MAYTLDVQKQYHKFDLDDFLGPQENFFTPNRQRLSYCIHMLRQKKGEWLNRGEGKSTAIAHMINWEIDDGPPGKEFLVLCNTNLECDMLIDYVRRLYIFFHQPKTASYLDPNRGFVATERGQIFHFLSASQANTQSITTRKYQKVWGDINFSSLKKYSYTNPYQYQHESITETFSSISSGLVECVTHLEARNAKVFI